MTEMFFREMMVELRKQTALLEKILEGQQPVNIRPVNPEAEMLKLIGEQPAPATQTVPTPPSFQQRRNKRG